MASGTGRRREYQEDLQVDGVLLGVYPPNLCLSSLRALHRLLTHNNQRARRFCEWLDGILVQEMQRRIRERQGEYLEACLPEIDLQDWQDADVGAGLVVAAVLLDGIRDPGMADFMKRLVFLFSVEARERLGG